MTESQAKNHRCVIGEIPSMPNKLNYLQPISSRRLGVWIGHCKGDKSHKEHLIVLKKAKKYFLLNNVTDIFKKPDGKVLGSRLFERFPQLRCPEGKVYMNLQRTATKSLNMNTVDIYRCKGNFKGSGHKEHFIRIQHGQLEVEINKKMIGVLIVTIESD